MVRLVQAMHELLPEARILWNFSLLCKRAFLRILGDIISVTFSQSGHQDGVP
jgi:hypothetical protein